MLLKVIKGYIRFCKPLEKLAHPGGNAWCCFTLH
jgi:hypothetical protein